MSAADPVVGFLRDLVRIPSLPGEEGEAAARVRRELDAVGFDEVSADAAGNVRGLVRGRGEAPAVLFLTHLDHVDAGDPADWPHPPFGGEVHGGRVWGRGAVDIKGPLAAQVHGVAALADGRPPPGDVLVMATVQEEVGGVGALHACGDELPDLAVVGEPSSNRLRRGHRGRGELTVRVRGRSAHASAPERGANPHYVAADFLGRLESVELPGDPELGAATVAPTLVATDQESSNVIPGEVRLTLDCRLVPGRGTGELRDLLEPHLEAAVRPGTEAGIEVPVFARETYTGLRTEMPAEIPAYLLPEDDPAVVTAGAVLEEALGGRPEVGVWGFATDGGHLAAAGVDVVGFGPGEEERAHTVEERVAVEELAEAARGYEALARSWPSAWEDSVSG